MSDNNTLSWHFVSVMEAKVFVSRKDPANKIAKFVSGVSGRELLDIVLMHEDFGLGRVESDQGNIVTRDVSSVPDGSYTFFPKQSGKLVLIAYIYGVCSEAISCTSKWYCRH